MQAVWPVGGEPVTAVQVPMEPVRLQDWQDSPHPVLQQTPSAQWFVEHSWSSPLHLSPMFFLGRHWWLLEQ
jgi:hypothetical protein